MRSNLTAQEVSSILVQSQNPSEFVKAAYSYLRAQNSKFSFEVLRRKAGFSSRSYAREVMIGKRRITRRSISGFAAAFGLSPTSSRYFECLCLISEPRLLGPAEQLAAIQKRAEKLKRKLVQESLKIDETAPVNKIFNELLWPAIYAALGVPGKGSELLRIMQVTGITKKTLVEQLECLEQAGLIERRHEEESVRYFAKQDHLSISDLGGSAFFKSFFDHNLKHIQQSSQRDFSNPNHMFVSSVLSVKKKDLGTIQEKVERTLFCLIDEIEDGDGDVILTLAFGSSSANSEQPV